MEEDNESISVKDDKDRKAQREKFPTILCLSLICVFLSGYILYIHSTSGNLSKSCYLTIDNFITLKQKFQNTSDYNNTFDVKTYARSTTKPYLIELLINSKKDCLCCPN